MPIVNICSIRPLFHNPPRITFAPLRHFISVCTSTPNYLKKKNEILYCNVCWTVRFDCNTWLHDSKQEHGTPGCYTGHQGVPKHCHLPKNIKLSLFTPLRQTETAEVQLHSCIRYLFMTATKYTLIHYIPVPCSSYMYWCVSHHHEGKMT